jgi:hypothetical protein
MGPFISEQETSFKEIEKDAPGPHSPNTANGHERMIICAIQFPVTLYREGTIQSLDGSKIFHVPGFLRAKMAQFGDSNDFFWKEILD